MLKIKKITKGCLWIFSLSILCLVVFSCNKNDEDSINYDFSKGNGTIGVRLGKKLENPYSISNMQRAYDTLLAKGLVSDTLRIKASHLYIKIIPQDSIEMNHILADTNLELFPYPLDYEIEGIGEYIVGENSTPVLYSVIPADYHIDNMIHYEVLERCFIPDESEHNPELALLEAEALKLTNNYHENGDSKVSNKQKFSWPQFGYPKGYVKVKVTETSNYEGVRKIKVRIRNVVKVSSVYTNSNGYYSSKKGFLSDVHYSAVFENERGFKIWSNLGPFSPAIHNVGWHRKSGYDIIIGANSCAWPWATINNAALDYYDKVCPSFQVQKPYNGLRFWYLSGNRFVDNIADGWAGSAPMLRNLALSQAQLATYLFVLGLLENNPTLSYVTAGIYGIMLCLPDIFITNVDEPNTNDLRAHVFHEMSHASHYAQVGSAYWVQYIFQICCNFIATGGENAYGDSLNGNNNIIGVGEMWASYFEYQCTDVVHNYHRGLQDTDEWYAPQILKEIDDVSDSITPRSIFDALVFQVQTHDDLRRELIGRYGLQNEINQIFESNGF